VTDIYAVGSQGNGGVIYHSSGGPGGMWSPTTTSMGLYAVWGSAADDVFVGGSIFMHSSTGPSGFTTQTTPANAFADTMWGSGPSDVYAASNGGGLLHYTTAKGWQTVTGLGTTALWAVGGSGASDVYVGGNRYLAHWDGNGWSSVSLPTSLSGVFFQGIWASAPTDVYAVGSNAAAIAHFDGTSWTAQLLPSGLGPNPMFASVSGTSVSDVYVASGNYVLHHP
jgi:hypothetical protein